MKSYVQYSKEVLALVMRNLKKGVSGSIIADTLVSNYGFDRKSALTIITGTMIICNRR